MHTGSTKQTYLLIGGIILVSLLIVAGVFFISRQGQQYKTPAQIPTCHEGTAPLPIMPGCEKGDGEPGCTAPEDGYCKLKSPQCYECRFGDGGGLKMICKCETATPTPPEQTKQICEAPKMCLPSWQCVPADAANVTPESSAGGGTNTGSCAEGLICCMPGKPTVAVTPTDGVNKVTPTTGLSRVTPTVPAGITPTTSVPTATPTTPPIGGPQATPTPTGVTSQAPTSTPRPGVPASTSAPNPTSIPQLPKAGIPSGMFALLGIGFIILVLGLAL